MRQLAILAFLTAIGGVLAAGHLSTTTHAGPVGKMHWSDQGTGKIQRANTDGSDVEDLVATGLVSPVFIALDTSGGKMYWTDDGTDKIQRANLDGSGVEDLVTTGLSSPSGIALDVAAGKMYWTDNGTDKIQRANLDGSGVEDLVTTGLITPAGIALDIAAGKMYWADAGSVKIQRANLDGSGVEDLVTTGLAFPDGLALDVAASKMYWTDPGTGKIQRAGLDGSNVEDLVTGIFPIGLALDVAASKMYWTDPNTDKIQRANLDGSDVEDLVTGLDLPVGIALTPCPDNDGDTLCDRVDPDDDNDGCTDVQELAPKSAAAQGGGRDPLDFWDFFDTPDPNATPQRDGTIAISDILRVIGRFGTSGDPTIDPLSTPPKTGYHPAYDRGGVAGPNPWNLAPANGSIDISDIVAVLTQYGHSCAAPP